MWEWLTVHGTVCQEPDGTFRVEGSRPAVILPGSFNPLHHGHTRLAAVVAAMRGRPVAYELSIANVDKPELAATEVEKRLRQFLGLGAIWITRAATFLEKSRLFPGTTFVVGYDTAARLLDAKYYQGNPARREESLRELLANGVHFLVGGRLDASNVFRIWDNHATPNAFASLFTPLLEDDFRADISSTSLRSQR